MAFVIKCENITEAYNVVRVFNEYLNRSRFTLSGRLGGIEVKQSPRKTVVEIRGVRLLEKKGYCGNHAGPCRFTGRKHRKTNLLEGLDWASFNDMLNDALDSIGHRGNVYSTACIIRKGRCRRIEYDKTNDHGEWEYDTSPEYYVDCIGKEVPETIYPHGTPGIVGWSKDSVESPHEEA